MRNDNASQDVRLILQLDRLREGARMCKARRWWRDKFWPRTAADYLKVEMAYGTRQNKSLRQVASYWGMAGSFLTRIHGQPREGHPQFQTSASLREASRPNSSLGKPESIYLLVKGRRGRQHREGNRDRA
ncbi:MAG TPA: hypothetical protein VMP12_06470 [Candidatus Sulfotelmatobacter sp.]|nr:hypothetical protein [Candidatus Sulfotelmatobacter sp.]